MFMWNPAYFVFIAPALLLTLFAQFKVQGTYRKYSQVCAHGKCITLIEKCIILSQS